MRKWWLRHKVAVYLTFEELTMLNDLCKIADKSMSKFIRELIVAEYKNMED